MGTIDAFFLFWDIPTIVPQLREQLVSMPIGNIATVEKGRALDRTQAYIFLCETGYQAFGTRGSGVPAANRLSIDGLMAYLTHLIAEWSSEGRCDKIAVRYNLPQEPAVVFSRTEGDRRAAEEHARIIRGDPQMPVSSSTLDAPAPVSGPFSIDIFRVQNGHKGVIHPDPKETEFINSSITNMERKDVPLNSRNFVYLESEKRNDGTVPRIYNRRGLEAVRNGRHPWSRKNLRHNNLRRLPRLNRSDIM